MSSSNVFIAVDGDSHTKAALKCKYLEFNHGGIIENFLNCTPECNFTVLIKGVRNY